MNQVNPNSTNQFTMQSGKTTCLSFDAQTSAGIQSQLLADRIEISILAMELNEASESSDFDFVLNPEDEAKLQFIEQIFGNERAREIIREIMNGRKIAMENKKALTSSLNYLYHATAGRLEANRFTAESVQIRSQRSNGEKFQVEYTRISMDHVTGAQNQIDPIILDLDDDGIETTTVEKGVRFDIDGDGVKEKSVFVTGGDGFLSLYPNQNDRIDSGKELFGDQNGALNGFLELAKFDQNLDHQIDARDRIFADLLFYQEKNGDGISQEGELYQLSEYNIKSILLEYQNVTNSTNGNVIAQIGTYQTNDQKNHTASDDLLITII